MSLKNSKRAVRAGRTLRLVPSVAHERFMALAVPVLRQLAPPAPIAVPYALALCFDLKGRMDSDLDNLTSTVLDLLMVAGIVADDALCVRLVADKRGGASDWCTTITITDTA